MREYCVSISLTEINEQTVLAVLVLHQEELQVLLLLLFASLGLWTPARPWCLRWAASRKVRCSAVISEGKKKPPSVGGEETTMFYRTGLQKQTKRRHRRPCHCEAFLPWACSGSAVEWREQTCLHSRDNIVLGPHIRHGKRKTEKKKRSPFSTWTLPTCMLSLKTAFLRLKMRCRLNFSSVLESRFRTLQGAHGIPKTSISFSQTCWTCKNQGTTILWNKFHFFQRMTKQKSQTD